MLGNRRGIAVVMLAAFSMTAALALRPISMIIAGPYGDDAFYALSVAYHFAHGHGFTINGLDLTNGVQPLIVLLYAAIFRIPGVDQFLGVRLTILLAGAINAASCFLIWRLIRRATLRNQDPESSRVARRAAIIGSALYAALYTIIIYTANGLETGLYSLLILLTLNVLIARPRPVWLGVVLGLTVLARIDAALFVVCLALWLIWTEHYTIRQTATTCAIAFLITTPWWLYNLFNFGSLMPISGQAEAVENTLNRNIYIAGHALGDVLMLVVYAPNFIDPFGWLYAFGVAAAFYSLARHFQLRPRLRAQFDIRPLAPLVAFGLLAFFYYVFFFGAPHFLMRYAQPLRLAWLVIFSIALALLLGGPKISRTIVVAVLAAALAFSIPRYLKHYSEEPSDLAQTAQWALGHPQERVGMTQSGIAGFLDSSIVNLDGKVNLRALRALQTGNEAGYIQSERLSVLADWPDLLAPILDKCARAGIYFHPIDTLGRVVIYKRID